MSKEKSPRPAKTTKPRANRKTAVVATSASAETVASMPTPADLDAEIRRRAYELYLQRDELSGDPNQDWLMAEQEIRSRYSS